MVDNTGETIVETRDSERKNCIGLENDDESGSATKVCVSRYRYNFFQDSCRADIRSVYVLRREGFFAD